LFQSKSQSFVLAFVAVKIDVIGLITQVGKNLNERKKKNRREKRREKKRKGKEKEKERKQSRKHL
jgi:hypothetical protein